MLEVSAKVAAMAEVRIDKVLLSQGLASSRSQAQAWLKQGKVEQKIAGQWQRVKKPSLPVATDAELRVNTDEADLYVSRGGVKLKGALTQAGLNLEGLNVLDIGLSTGGFSDCVLQHGAAQVIGVDVGHDQLAASLHQHPQLLAFDGINARDLPIDMLLDKLGAPGFDLIIMDVSFISQSLIAPQFKHLLNQGGRALCLVKPQFEVGPEGIGKGGIVKDQSLYHKVKQDICALYTEHGLTVLDYFSSPIQGGDGNHEFFIYATLSE